MAALIRPSRGSKFTKDKIEVVPNPSLFVSARAAGVRVLRGVQPGDSDEFGRTTMYRVSYELHSLNKGNIAVRVLKALGRLVGIDKKAEVVTVEYAHEGDRRRRVRIPGTGYVEYGPRAPVVDRQGIG